MTFLETPRFPQRIALGAVGGPEFATEIITLRSGREQRIPERTKPRRRYVVTTLNFTETEFEELDAFFLVLMGRAHSFRIWDPRDYSVTITNGRLGPNAIGTGAPTYQLTKHYAAGALTMDRAIRKPVSGTVAAFRNAGALTVGAAPGNIAIDTTTGIITFVPDASKTITGITQANPGVVTATAHGYSNGDLIWLDGVGGMTQVNNLAFTIAGVTTDTFNIGVNTTAYSAYTTGGLAKKFPQPADALTWSGEFDVPVRFDVDRMQASTTKRAGAGFAITWDSVELIEDLDA